MHLQMGPLEEGAKRALGDRERAQVMGEEHWDIAEGHRVGILAEGGKPRRGHKPAPAKEG